MLDGSSQPNLADNLTIHRDADASTLRTRVDGQNAHRGYIVALEQSSRADTFCWYGPPLSSVR